MKVFIKICGLACAEDVAAVAALRPDALGFVFWPRSPRAVTPEQVASWTRALPPDILKVGVFVDPAPEELRRTVTTARLNIVQWHGHAMKAEGGRRKADEVFQSLEKTLSGVSGLWKVVRPDRGPGGSPTAIRDVEPFVDAILLDSYSPTAPGGTGQVGDWAAARDFVAHCRKPVLLAGGLKPANVRAAVQAVRPWGVDVSTGVEARPGQKDLELVKRFIETCRTL